MQPDGGDAERKGYDKRSGEEGYEQPCVLGQQAEGIKGVEQHRGRQTGHGIDEPYVAQPSHSKEEAHQYPEDQVRRAGR